MSLVKDVWNNPRARLVTGVIVGALLLFVVGFGAGRQSKPAQVKTVTQEKVVYQDRIVKVEAKTEAKDQETQQAVHKVIVYVEKPDGTKVTTTTEDVGTKTEKADRIQDTVKTQEQVRATEDLHQTVTVTNARPQWRVGVAGGLNLGGFSLTKPIGALPWVVGLDVDRQIIGPIWAGAWAQVQTSNLTPTIGLRLSFEF